MKAYKEKHGHLNVKEREDKSLSRFCRKTRQALKYPEKVNTEKLNAERIKSLNTLGFDWGLSSTRTKYNRISFEERIEDLRLYKEKHVHLNVGKREDKSLSCFCRKTQVARKYPEKVNTMKLSYERRASLNAIGCY